MTRSLAEAREFAFAISKRYGRTVVIRERSRRESYQAIASDAGEDLDLCGSVVEVWDGGVAA